jgi:AcrR family transcriptional regulator
MSDFEPRKRPQQARSQATWDAIVEAGAQLLVEQGFHNCSTNGIAERAGVSIGSLYQYFPNKEAVIAAVVDRFVEKQFEILMDGLEANAPLQDSVRRLVQALVDAKQSDPELSRVMFEQMPSIDQTDLLREWNERACRAVRLALESRRDEIDVEDLEMASFLVVTACHGVIHSTVLDRPELLEEDRLVQHTTRLILRYLGASID